MHLVRNNFVKVRVCCLCKNKSNLTVLFKTNAEVLQKDNLGKLTIYSVYTPLFTTTICLTSTGFFYHVFGWQSCDIFLSGFSHGILHRHDSNNQLCRHWLNKNWTNHKNRKDLKGGSFFCQQIKGSSEVWLTGFNCWAAARGLSSQWHSNWKTQADHCLLQTLR